MIILQALVQTQVVKQSQKTTSILKELISSYNLTLI